MRCNLNLIVYHSPLYPAHWALWIPSYNAEIDAGRTIGKLIQVEGDSSTGFSHDFKNDHDITLDGRRKTVIFLCTIDGKNNIDEQEEDDGAASIIEKWALTVPAPAPSLRSAHAVGPRLRVQLKNCQTWVRDVVVALVENGVVPEQALEELNKSSRN